MAIIDQPHLGPPRPHPSDLATPVFEPDLKTSELIARLNDQEHPQAKSHLTRYINRCRISSLHKESLSRFLIDPVSFLRDPDNEIDRIRSKHSLGQFIGFELKRLKLGSICLWLELDNPDHPRYVVRWDDSSKRPKLAPLTVRYSRDGTAFEADKTEPAGLDSDNSAVSCDLEAFSGATGSQPADQEVRQIKRLCEVDLRVGQSPPSRPPKSPSLSKDIYTPAVAPTSPTKSPGSDLDPHSSSCFSSSSQNEDNPNEPSIQELTTAIKTLRSLLNSAFDINTEQLKKLHDSEAHQQRLIEEWRARVEEVKLQAEHWKRQCETKDIELTGRQVLLMDSMNEVNALRKETRQLQSQLKDAVRPGQKLYNAFSTRLRGEVAKAQAELVLARTTIQRLQFQLPSKESTGSSGQCASQVQETQKWRSWCLTSMEKNRELVAEVEQLKANIAAARPRQPSQNQAVQIGSCSSLTSPSGSKQRSKDASSPVNSSQYLDARPQLGGPIQMENVDQTSTVPFKQLVKHSGHSRRKAEDEMFEPFALLEDSDPASSPSSPPYQTLSNADTNGTQAVIQSSSSQEVLSLSLGHESLENFGWLSKPEGGGSQFCSYPMTQLDATHFSLGDSSSRKQHHTQAPAVRNCQDGSDFKPCLSTQEADSLGHEAETTRDAFQVQGSAILQSPPKPFA